MRLTLKTLYEARLPQRLAMCDGDPRLLALVNLAQERLLNRGSWWGTTARLRVCVRDDGCLVWPREVAMILGAKLSGEPLQLLHEWYTFSALLSPEMTAGPVPAMSDMGQTSTVNPHRSGDLVAAYAASALDSGKTLTVYGYDQNGNWVRTPGDGGLVDGEALAITQAGVVSQARWKSVTAVAKDVTQDVVRLYSYADGAPTRLIGVYQPSETAPLYRVTRVSGIVGCESKTLDVVAKLAHVPVCGPSDFLILQNAAAMIYAVESLADEENGRLNEAEVKWQKAIRELRHELKTMTGQTGQLVIAPFARREPNRVFGGFV